MTHALVGVITADNKGAVIYCHAGTPDALAHVVKGYTAFDMAHVLALGNASRLAPNVWPPRDAFHSLLQPIADVSVFYNRDDRRRMEPAETFEHTRDLASLARRNDANYIYLLDESGKWLMSKHLNHDELRERYHFERTDYDALNREALGFAEIQ